MEKYLASSTFELELYNATSNSNATQASTKGMYLIAEKSHNYECLLTIIARIRQRLISDQRKKWKRINKTVHLIEFLLKNGSFQFVIVFIDKFLHLVKPYANYSYSEDGMDRGFAVRECSKRILELAEDRPRLKDERAEAANLRKRIQGEGKDSKTSSKSRRRYVVDEEAFYNQKDGGDDDRKTGSGGNRAPGSSYDAPLKEPNLARKLGLEDDPNEEPKPASDKDKNRKKTKEELEKEKEIDEVRKIIENDGKLNKYIKEVDLLGVDVQDSAMTFGKNGAQKSQNSDFDLLGTEIGTAGLSQQGKSGSLGLGGIPTNQFGKPPGAQGQNSAPRNITFNGNHTADSTEYGDFQSAGDQTKGLSKNLKKEEIDLLDFDDMTKKK